MSTFTVTYVLLCLKPFGLNVFKIFQIKMKHLLFHVDIRTPGDADEDLSYDLLLVYRLIHLIRMLHQIQFIATYFRSSVHQSYQ